MSIVRKRTKEREYVYFESYVNGRKQSIFCGPADEPSSWEKARMLEQEYVYGRFHHSPLVPFSWELYPSFNKPNIVYYPNEEVIISLMIKNTGQTYIHISGVMVKTDWMKDWYRFDSLDISLPPNHTKPLPTIKFEVPIDIALGAHLCLIGVRMEAFQGSVGWVDCGIVPTSKPYFIEVQQPPLKNFSIFISHSTADLSLVSTLSDWLRRCGISAYVAEVSPEYGEKLSQKVARAIDSCDCVIAILTQSGTKSQWVSWELGYARKAGKPIIPIVEKGTDVKPFIPLADLEYITLDRLNPYNAIVEAVSLATRKLGEKQRNTALGILAILFLIGLFSGGLGSSKR